MNPIEIEQLKKRFYEKYPEKDTHHFGWAFEDRTDKILSFIISELSSLLERKAGEIGKLKKKGELVRVGCPDGKIGCCVFHQEFRETEEVKIHNKALQSAQDILVKK